MSSAYEVSDGTQSSRVVGGVPYDAWDEKDEDALQRTNLRTKERARSIDHHQGRELLPVEEVTNCAASDTQKRASRQAVKEPRYDHSLNVAGYCTRNKPYQEKSK
ncbi:hypothetical protein V6Z92_009954 [Aspergillus fumigatus]